VLILLERSWFTPRLRDRDGDVVQLRPVEVTYYNGFQVSDSYRQFYCQDDQFDLAKEMADKYPDICDMERPRITVNG
jgi:hypothetical protein